MENKARHAGLRCVCGDVDFEPKSYAFLFQDGDVPRLDGPDSTAHDDNALYHEVEYPSYLHPRLHPDNFATMASLFGLPSPPDPSRCRYLDIGCGTGHSILAFAGDLPEATFVGVDFSTPMIEEARRTAAELGLRNTTFVDADVLEFDDASAGPFDYIAIHGMMSWVPDPVARRMLEICRDRLTPNGMVYISFNANPGYLLPAMLRDIGTEGWRYMKGPSDVVEALDRIRRSPLDELPEPRRKLLQPCLENVLESAAGQMMYDEFGDINKWWRFGELCDLVSGYGLRYVTEAGIENWTARTLSQDAQRLLHDLAEEPVRRMQYRDCLRLTRFHASIFCRATEQQTPANEPLPAKVTNLLLTTRAFPTSGEPDIAGPGKESFEAPGGAAVALADPVLKALLHELHQRRPARLTLEELVAGICQATGIAESWMIAQKIFPVILPLWETGLLDLYWHMPKLASQAGEKPVGSPFAAICARVGSRTLPGLLGYPVFLDSEDARLLFLALDGTRTRDDLRTQFTLDADALEARLREFARLGLLLA
jgi:SAM-dependent methyltransferase